MDGVEKHNHLPQNVHRRTLFLIIVLDFGDIDAEKVDGVGTPPIGCFAVISYWKAGNIDWRFAALLAIGFTVGAYVGAALLNRGFINQGFVRLLLSTLLLYVTSRLLFIPTGEPGRRSRQAC